MALRDALDSPIDETDPALQPFLTDLQANILKGHGRHNTVNRFLSFDPGSGPAIGTAIAQLATGGDITSSAVQLAHTAAVKAGTGDPDMPVAFFFLSSSGYAKLGMPEASSPDDPSFRAGMKARREFLGDPAVSDWDATFQQEIDALLLTGSTTAPQALAHADALSAPLVAAGASVIGDEIGKALINDAREGIEHFGYVDGRSQPLLLKADVDGELAAAGGTPFAWDPAFSPIKTALVHDAAGAGEHSFGSYFVFRKLEQLVRAFKTREEELADALGLTGDDRERAGALVVGRFEDGTPVISALAPLGGKPPNNFNFDTDVEGRICPFQGHVRKTNPRGDVRRQFGLPDDEGDRKPIMARRGITYGDRTDDPNGDDEKPEGGVGLLFMAYQRSFEEQFEFTQVSWANNIDFLRDGVGIDPVIGHETPSADGKLVEQKWPKWPGSKTDVSFRFADFVKMKGGEYFFAPSISFLSSLGEPKIAFAQ